MPGGQRIFEWDTFFNGMLASLEDPEAAREDFLGMLSYQQPNGMVPNVASPIGEISIDRSQPPVGSLCLWNYFQHTGDSAFIQDVFPAMLDWNRWWFKINPETGKPYRDGNENGLLEWGTSDVSILDLGKLQLAKFESGQDNSPMFDKAILNPATQTIELDMVGLSALWAMDTEFLIKLAGIAGEEGTIRLLKKELSEISDKINMHLWNEKEGRYADRYWEGKSKKPDPKTAISIPATWFLTSENGGNGLIKSVFKDEQLLYSETVSSIVQNTKVSEGGRIEWKGNLRVDEDEEYFFYSPDENGVRLFINNKKLFDNRRSFITEYVSQSAVLKAGEDYSFHLIYEGNQDFELTYSTTGRNHNKEVFSETFPINAFYPLIAGIPDSARGARMLSLLTDSTYFWGEYITPVVSRRDPAFPLQGYWRGRIWPPTNYLLFQGVKRYASPDIIADYAEKSVNLFMRHWNQNYLCYENWYADGRGAGFPHYTWGALNLLIGLEATLDIDDSGAYTSNESLNREVSIRNYPVRGEIIHYKTK